MRTAKTKDLGFLRMKPHVVPQGPAYWRVDVVLYQGWVGTLYFTVVGEQETV